MSEFTHFFRRFLETEKWTPQTCSLLECMFGWDGKNDESQDGGGLHSLNVKIESNKFIVPNFQD